MLTHLDLQSFISKQTNQLVKTSAPILDSLQAREYYRLPRLNKNIIKQSTFHTAWQLARTLNFTVKYLVTYFSSGEYKTSKEC